MGSNLVQDTRRRQICLVLNLWLEFKVFVHGVELKQQSSAPSGYTRSLFLALMRVTTNGKILGLMRGQISDQLILILK
jgi:hypothetical protein